MGGAAVPLMLSAGIFRRLRAGRAEQCVPPFQLWQLAREAERGEIVFMGMVQVVRRFTLASSVTEWVHSDRLG